MKLANEIVTLFNARYDIATGYDVYERTIITGVAWFGTTSAAIISQGLKESSTVTIRIPQDADFANKQYLDPIAYSQSGDTTNYFTFQNGDLLVRGAIYDDDLKFADLQKQYNAVTILGITDNRRARAPHWKVIGK